MRMSDHDPFARLRMAHWLRWGFGLLLVLWLGGCASVFSAQVSRFQQWPADAQGARYWIEPSPQGQNNLEFETYADMLRAALGPTGLVEADRPERARFVVHMQYASQAGQGWRQEWVDPFFDGGPYIPRFHGIWGRWGPGPSLRTVPVRIYRLQLEVRLEDQTQDGREVFRATAVTESTRDQLSAAMPYLARAVFQGFPGRNGEVIPVRVPLD